MLPKSGDQILIKPCGTVVSFSYLLLYKLLINSIKSMPEVVLLLVVNNSTCGLTHLPFLFPFPRPRRKAILLSYTRGGTSKEKAKV